MHIADFSNYFHDLARFKGLDFFGFYFIELCKYFLSAILIWFLIYKVFWPFTKSRRIQNKDFLFSEIAREIFFSLSHLLIAVAILIYPIKKYYLHTAIYYSTSQHGYLWFCTSFFFLILLHESFFYWSHYLLHTDFMYRSIHFVHHKSKNPSPFSSYCLHPVESFLQIIWLLPVLILIPIHFYVLSAFLGAALLVAFGGHLGVELYPRSLTQSRWGKYLGSATYHNIHHITEAHNLGLYFRFWDFWMGTDLTYTGNLPISHEALSK